MVPKSKTLKRIGIIASVCVLFIVACVVFTPLNDALTAPLINSETGVPADVIIVLGGGLEKDGSVGEGVYERIDQGVALLDQSLAPYILMSGGPVQNTSWNESEQMSQYAQSLGVPPQNIMRESESTSTEENARYSQEILSQRGWSTVLLVTSPFHTRRACRVFRQKNINITCIAADTTNYPRTSVIERLKMFRTLLREYGATVYYEMKGYI
ncbi:MAG: YdcF family protein [Patescibacteria group bacterium]|jgi:uncharacterized SAM-binding protein YcdF (DUF218 family)